MMDFWGTPRSRPESSLGWDVMRRECEVLDVRPRVALSVEDETKLAELGSRISTGSSDDGDRVVAVRRAEPARREAA